jgi:hypothetical protein
VADPISNIEDRKSQTDLGVFGARIYAGALEETGDLLQAFFITVAFFRGMIGGGGDQREQEDDSGN